MNHIDLAVKCSSEIKLCGGSEKHVIAIIRHLKYAEKKNS